VCFVCVVSSCNDVVMSFYDKSESNQFDGMEVFVMSIRRETTVPYCHRMLEITHHVSVNGGGLA